MAAASLPDFGRAASQRAEAEMRERPLPALEAMLADFPPARPFATRLTRQAGPLPRVIAEMKRRSPSAGSLRSEYDPRRIALGYARVGAACVSVLTEPAAFGGDLAHLHQVRPAHLPILRKDFLVTSYQVAQSRVAGADAVLLIAALLEGPLLLQMMEAARRYGVEALVEVHDEEEMARAAAEGATLIGVNSRDLKTMTVDLGVAERLAGRAPAGAVLVAESGIRERKDLDRLMAAGYEAFLIGEALMRPADPGDALWRLLQPA